MFELIKPTVGLIREPIQLKDWSENTNNNNTNNNNTDNKNIAELVISLSNKILFYNEKRISLWTWFKLPKRKTIIITIGDKNQNTCTMLSINTHKRIGSVEIFTPHAGICATIFAPKELMEIVELLCVGLCLKKIMLQDAAIVKLCRHDEKTIKIGDEHENNVPLSALLLVTTGKSYYERYNFVPSTKEKPSYNVQLNKAIKLPAFIISFLHLKTKYSKRGNILKKAIIEYDAVCKQGTVPRKVHTWIIKNLKKLDIPIMYKKNV